MTEEFSLPILPEIWQATLDWHQAASQQAQFQQLYEGILAGNAQLNLTRITQPEEFWEKHLWDSLVGIQPWLKASPPEAFQFGLGESAQPKVIDIGTGGGFPGIPVAIAQPTWNLTLLDSTRKKLAFLDALLPELGLQNVQTLVGRAEEAGVQASHRAAYDLALIRAVAGVTICAEYCLPLLKVGGFAVLYRGQWSEEEAIALQSAVEVLGGAVVAIEPVTLPLSQGVRHSIYLQKTQKTPARYPRSPGVPGQKPL
ncbi:MAG: 16S rRNA (guanine(527)-N(7))-methyltransferase RsmG [Oculatellaceae cyanobacterium Prado106]|jgi:16S rRNA (guanine527-N7)-methyltransferase|nr:16S rRNA (guanine(527)-N(7))-methyltransferase RsmG [Oculatellaceae cyanobacterium Prado106]